MGSGLLLYLLVVVVVWGFVVGSLVSWVSGVVLVFGSWWVARFPNYGKICRYGERHWAY